MTAPPTATPSYASKLNPLNYMPAFISNTREFDEHQAVSLPLEREASTIPRGDGTGTWEYPSPQQMYNAMLRKGYTDTPAEHVEAMVSVHNFLNEGAWEEIREWERRFGGGLLKGWEESKRGEEGGAMMAALQAIRDEGKTDMSLEPRLVRFMGRPNERTPKARIGIERWRAVEQDRKKGWRVLLQMGLPLFLGAVLRVRDLDQSARGLSRSLGITIKGVVLSDPTAAIDVDKPADYTLVNAILAGRA